MLNKKIALLGAAAIAMVSTGANAATVSATAEVDILAPVTLSQTATLDFGVVAAAAAAGTVQLPNNSDTRVCSVGLACVGAANRGAFSVTGANTYTVVVTVDASTTLTGGGPPVEFNPDPSVSTRGTTRGTPDVPRRRHADRGCKPSCWHLSRYLQCVGRLSVIADAAHFRVR